KLCASTQPAARAAAIGTLVSAAPAHSGDELRAAVVDADSRVRIAAAEALLPALATQRPRNGMVTETAYFGLSSQQVKIDPDRWLTEFRSGKRQPKWAKGLAQPLEQMIASERPSEERLA